MKKNGYDWKELEKHVKNDDDDEILHEINRSTGVLIHTNWVNQLGGYCGLCQKEYCKQNSFSSG